LGAAILDARRPQRRGHEDRITPIAAMLHLPEFAGRVRVGHALPRDGNLSREELKMLDALATARTRSLERQSTVLPRTTGPCADRRSGWCTG
jgi:hypothetical protein